MAGGFPTSKIELHQWMNSGLLLIVSFFVVQTYRTIESDHERIAQHDTSIATHNIRLNVLESERNGKHEPAPLTEAVLPDNDKRKRFENK